MSTETDRMASISNERCLYEDIKKLEQQELIPQMKQAEEALANLYLHKKLIEADFSELLSAYQNLIKEKIPFAKLLQQRLIEYFSFELLKPLPLLHVKSNASSTIWRMQHFVVLAQVNEQQDLLFSLSFDGKEQLSESSYLPLLIIKPAEMLVEINEEQVLQLIDLWYGTKILSAKQLSLVNADLNSLLDHFRALGFTNQPSLLDCSCVLQQEFYLANCIEAKVLDELFIATMAQAEYDFDKVATAVYRISLTYGQTVELYNHLEQPKVKVHSNECRRSIIDFLMHHSFLMPLISRTLYLKAIE